MTFRPTDEQDYIAQLYATRADVIVEAGAGAGKTSTIRYLANLDPRRSFQYMAFNTALVEDAVRTMPENVKSRTVHSLAMGAVGWKYQPRLKSSQRMRSTQIARILDIGSMSIRYARQIKTLDASRLAGVVIVALERFCQSADDEPSTDHFPYLAGIDDPKEDGRRGWANNLALRTHLLPALRRAWADAQEENGVLPYKHAYYLKLAQLRGMRIRRQVIVIDEAQDLAPVMLAIVEAQTHAQIIMVGDSAQAIYGFTGAIDALERARSMNAGAKRGRLSLSFRFGAAIAEAANVLLANLGTDLRLRGLASIESYLDRIPTPRAVLTRTNAVAVQEVLLALSRGMHPHLVGGGAVVTNFAKAALELKEGRPPYYAPDKLHPELACFESWAEVQAYVEQDEQGGELRLLVALVDEFGCEVIIDALSNQPPESEADLIVSTAHKAKGREWDTVRLGGDFGAVAESSPDDLRVLYVAITRARYGLDVEAVPGMLEVLGMGDVDVEGAQLSADDEAALQLLLDGEL